MQQCTTIITSNTYPILSVSGSKTGRGHSLFSSYQTKDLPRQWCNNMPRRDKASETHGNIREELGLGLAKDVALSLATDYKCVSYFNMALRRGSDLTDWESIFTNAGITTASAKIYAQTFSSEGITRDTIHMLD